MNLSEKIAIPDHDTLAHGFVDHWKQAEPGSRIPQLSRFLDRPSIAHAPHLFIFEVENGRLKVRLQGTGLVERWGRDFTGSVLYETKSERFREQSIDNFHKIINTPCGCYMVDHIQIAGGRMITRATTGSRSRIVLLPLGSSKGPPLVVAYSQEDGARAWDESFVSKQTTIEAHWIDLGAGVPCTPPSKPCDA